MLTPSPKVFFEDAAQLDPHSLPTRSEPRGLLMCGPEYFDVIDEKNVHMRGQKGRIDKAKAQAQWNQLRSVFEQQILTGSLDQVHVLAGPKDREDFVFAANPSFPWVMEDGQKVVIPGLMKHPSRQLEVVHHVQFFEGLGYEVRPLQNAPLFEGMGDVIPFPGRRLLFGGYGHRTSPATYPELARLLDTPIVCLELTDPRFYHLDTCFLPLSEEVVMIQPFAFNKTGRAILASLFDEVLEVPLNEAAEGFALNAHLLPADKNGQRHAVIQKGNGMTVSLLRHYGFEVHEVETSEFIRSGGSVFCLKQLVY